jgi:hypothetical protein
MKQIGTLTVIYLFSLTLSGIAVKKPGTQDSPGRKREPLTPSYRMTTEESIETRYGFTAQSNETAFVPVDGRLALQLSVSGDPDLAEKL